VRWDVGFDIVNATNSGAVLTYNQTFNASPAMPSQLWLPTSVLTPRFFNIGAQINF
jgi:hypothetical protein